MKKNLSILSMVPVYLVFTIIFILLTVIGTETVTVMAESAPVTGRRVIIIDAGHGDPDGGAVSCTGVHESVINLQISRRLNDLLLFLGYDTIMTRETDASIYTKGNTIAQKKLSDLNERIRIVNDAEKAILLSIHQNHYIDSRYHGAQMFWADTAGSQQLAEILQKAFVTHLNPDSHRAAKKTQGIYLMEHVQHPAVLVECGFLSNPGEEVQLRSDDYQKKVCCVIACGLTEFIRTLDR